MAAMQFGPPVLGALMGSKGGPDQVQSTETNTQNQAWNPGMADRWGQSMEGTYNQAMNNVNFGPTGYQNAMFDSLYSSAYGGQGGGGGGGGAGMGSQMQGRGGGGGGGGGGIMKRLAGNNVAFNDYETRVLDPGFMDWENNPQLAQRLAGMRLESDESQREAMSQAFGQFAGAGGTMGMTGMMAAGRGKLADDFGENLGIQQGQFITNYDQQLRAQQAAANQAWSGRESSYDTGAFSNDATKASARMQLQGVMAGIESQERQAAAAARGSAKQQAFNNQMAVFGLGSQMAGMQQQGAGLGQFGLTAAYGAAQHPYQQSFGSQTQQQTGTTPGSPGGWQGAVTGGTTGAGVGRGLGNYFGTGSDGNQPWARS